MHLPSVAIHLESIQGLNANIRFLASSVKFRSRTNIHLCERKFQTECIVQAKEVVVDSFHDLFNAGSREIP